MNKVQLEWEDFPPAQLAKTGVAQSYYLFSRRSDGKIAGRFCFLRSVADLSKKKAEIERDKHFIDTGEIIKCPTP